MARKVYKRNNLGKLKMALIDADIDFGFLEEEVEEIRANFEEGKKIGEIAKRIKRKEEEVLLLLIDLSLSKKTDFKSNFIRDIQLKQKITF